MSGSPTRTQWAKEVRAQLPAWGACVLVVVAGGLLHDPRAEVAGVLAYVLGTTVLGAQAVGHEHGYGTLTSLLAQPVERRTLLARKLGVLASMLAVLTACAWSVLVTPQMTRPGEPLGPFLVFAPFLALFVAPWITMATRNPIAGVVFSFGIPGAFLLTGQIVGTWLYGAGASRAVNAVGLAFLSRGTAALCIASAVLGWRAFMRLEAKEGRGADARLPDWLGGVAHADAPAPRRSHPVRALIAKELRLQQMSLAVAGMYLLGATGLALWQRHDPGASIPPLEVVSVPYFLALAMLTGSLASAEERQLGTLASQQLLPLSSRRQWVVKAGVAFLLALGLGLGAWGVARALDTMPIVGQPAGVIVVNFALVIVTVTSVSLYVSSLSSSGLRAAVLSVPALVGGYVYASTIERVLFSSRLHVMRATHAHVTSAAAMTTLWVVVPLGFSAVALAMASANHRTTAHSAPRIAWQAAGLAAAIAAGMAIAVWVPAIL